MFDVRYAAAGLLVVVLLCGTAFVASPADGEDLSPVPFDQTLSTGLTGVDVEKARSAGYVIPRGEVLYSEYEFVVGYYGVDGLASGLADAAEGGYYGDPLAVFVTDFAGTGPSLTDEGYVTLDSSVSMDWTRAKNASFVVDSGARTPGGATALPFSSRADANAFAAEYEGEVVDWQRVRDRVASDGGDAAARLAALRERRTAWADDAVGAATSLRNRPVSTVVGEDEPTLAAALEAAPPETTIRVPPGTYDAELTVQKPVTIRGAGTDTVLAGDGNGSVLTVRSPNAAITSVRVAGIGETLTGSADNATGDDWDERLSLIYGGGDAGIRLADARGALVADVTMDTPANGIVALNSSTAVVRNVSVIGSEDPQNGSMGVLAMYSDVVVEDSRLVGGRDGVYTHYSDGIVVRNTHMASQRFGVHQMYTSDALVANNTIRDTMVGGIVMTRPTGNVYVGNDVRESDQGIAVSGSASYASENVLVDNEIGLSISTDRSYYARNTMVGNDVGVRSDTLLPTNVVVANDVVGNDAFVDTGSGPQIVWAEAGRGNYWGEVPGMDRDGDGVIDRPFRPASRLDSGTTHSSGAATLARSPAVGAIREFQTRVAGLRGSSVLDPAPLAEPVRPEVLADLERGGTTAGGRRIDPSPEGDS